MRGVVTNRKCKYCRRNLHAIKTASWFGGIWNKTDACHVCLYCDRLEPGPIAGASSE